MQTQVFGAGSELPLEQQLSYSLRRHYVDEFLARAISPSSAKQALLDVGGVRTQQRGRFDPRASGLQVFAVNISSVKEVDILADAGHLPLSADSFEWVLCSEVLEHVDQPLRVLAETFRVLRHGGQLVVTVPFLFRVHADPVDVGRYTHWFWRQCLEGIGFGQIQIEKQGLFWSVAVDMFRDWLRYLVVDRGFNNRIVRSFLLRMVRRFRRAAIARDSRPNYQDHDFFGRYVGGFGILATKP